MKYHLIAQRNMFLYNVKVQKKFILKDKIVKIKKAATILG